MLAYPITDVSVHFLQAHPVNMIGPVFIVPCVGCLYDAGVFMKVVGRLLFIMVSRLAM